MNAGTVVGNMPARERATYAMGLVDALAYARFQKDTQAKGKADYTGMTCIRDWFHKDMVDRMQEVDAAFRQYKTYPPAMVITAMVGKACGK